MKRNMSDMDSDCDDVFTEDSSKGAHTPNGESCQLLNRKRRRGIIEKRRRDRINNSLSELRRLVPAAFEKQGSAKLEKAEILQMTVDHLKMLHAKGFDALSFDPQKFAMDYHSIGFRECASEVARYMVAIEGMDLQDPLRLRLMSHLQCYSAQRELALKSTSVHNPWNPAAPFATSTSPSYTATSSIPNHHHGSNTALSTEHTSSLSAATPYSCSDTRLGHLDSGMHHGSRMPSTAPMPPSSMSSSLNGGSSPMVPSLSQMTSNQYLTGHGFSSGYGGGGLGQQPPSSMKPYRPWGAELAY